MTVCRPRTPCTTGACRQHGMVLIAAMLCLLAIVALPLVAMEMGLTQSRPAAENRDLAMARQAAEAALRDGERDAAARAAVPGAGFDPVCTAGLCLPPANGQSWADALKTRPAFGIPLGTHTAPAAYWPDGIPRPRYLIEVLDSAAAPSEPRAYHVTAIGEGEDRHADGRPVSQVVLESLYIR